MVNKTRAVHIGGDKTSQKKGKGHAPKELS